MTTTILSGREKEIAALASFLRTRTNQGKSIRSVLANFFFIKEEEKKENYLKKFQELKKLFDQQVENVSLWGGNEKLFIALEENIISRAIIMWHKKEIKKGDYPFFLIDPKTFQKILKVKRIDISEDPQFVITKRKRGRPRKQCRTITEEAYVLFNVRVLNARTKRKSYFLNSFFENVIMQLSSENFLPEKVFGNKFSYPSSKGLFFPVLNFTKPDKIKLSWVKEDIKGKGLPFTVFGEKYSLPSVTEVKTKKSVELKSERSSYERPFQKHW